ncbi:unnamed protein product, partial [Didymodactylos carnosus]
LKEHQKLIHSYFLKLRKEYDNLVTDWFIEKINDDKNIAPCAYIIYQLKCNLELANRWPVPNYWIVPVLRFYSSEIKGERVLTQLQFKNIINKNPNILQHIIKKKCDWLCLIVALYGGYKNYNSQTNISEYLEIAQFLNLSDHEREPFLFYYQEIWGTDAPAYNMAVHLDTLESTKHWNKKPIFDINEIYKESSLTTQILELLVEEKSVTDLIEQLRMEIKSRQLSTEEKTEVLIALITLGDFDFINDIIKEVDETFLKNFKNRIEQLISTLKDPIARRSSKIANYLLKLYNVMKMNQMNYNLNFSDYCKIYLSLIASSGGLPIDTSILAETMDHVDDKFKLYAEYFVCKFTGASMMDLNHSVAVVLDKRIKSCNINQIIKSFLKISDTTQIYRPVRAYPWPTDIFNLKSISDDDIPISFFNCLENIHKNIAFIIDAISNVFDKEGYFNKNSELIPLVILLNFGNMSKYSKWMEENGVRLLPELNFKKDIKEVLSSKIKLMCNTYYKSRALCQLAEFYDEQCHNLLNESFQLAKSIQEPILKFQVLEKIFNIVQYKHCKWLVQEIIMELVLCFDNIESLYDKVIASIRLSFYGSRDFRQKYLRYAIDTLIKMNDDDEKIELIIKLKPFISIYDDFQSSLNEIIENLKNKTQNYYINSYYGKILFTGKLLVNTSNSSGWYPSDKSENSIDNKQNEESSDYVEIQTLFTLFAQLNDIKLIIANKDNINQLWINLFKHADNELNIERIVEIALDNELFLTPQVAIIIDGLIQNGKENKGVVSISRFFVSKNFRLKVTYVESASNAEQNGRFRLFLKKFYFLPAKSAPFGTLKI